MTVWRAGRRCVVLLVCVATCAVGCSFLWADVPEPPAPRDAMRAFVVDIAARARTQRPGFLVVPQNGEELLSLTADAAGPLAGDYVAAIDGFGREDLFFGYEADNEPTPPDATDWMLSYLNRAESLELSVLTTDYCWTPARVDVSYANNAAQGFAAFAAPRRELDIIPDAPPFGENTRDIQSLGDVVNFLYLINPDRFENAASMVAALAATTYDLLILDLDLDGEPLSVNDVAALKRKANGGSRLVLCYVSIGEAEDYRDYWQADWDETTPAWLLEENPEWPGNYPVQYWHPDWQAIMFARLDAVLAAGFDGVYLDRIDVYEEFES